MGKKHDILVRDLEARLKERGKYDFVAHNLNYNVAGIIGEVDVISYRHNNNTFYFWEIKSTYSKKSYKRALEQYHRFCEAYPNKRVKGIMVTPTYVRRLR